MAKEITKEELKESLRHYWRMRNWAKKQDPNEDTEGWEMDDRLGESWFENDCYLCNTYSFCLEDEMMCRECPLFLNGHHCVAPNILITAWGGMTDSDTWAEWILAATNMARVIMKLPRVK